MTQFIEKGDVPFTDAQLQKRTQTLIERDWPEWKRERSIRLGDGELNTYMEQVATDTTVNRRDNTFNEQLVAYTKATSRLAQYIIADGRVELTEMQATGEQVWNEDTMEMDNVMASVITQSAIEAVEATVIVSTYGEDIDEKPTVSIVTNPLIVTDVAEREAAQAVISATPQAVKDA
tara:strand:- start:172 stop:702 length:531 start_codon:yes stop_codon:yes gene_type:complete